MAHEDTADLNGGTILPLLAHTSLFSVLAPEQLARVEAISRRVEYSQDEPIYDVGDSADDLFVLERGTVRFNFAWRNRTARSGHILRSGEVFGWAALLEGSQRRICTAHCISPSRVVAINGRELCSAMDQDHTLGYLVMRKLSLLITGNLTTFAAG